MTHVWSENVFSLKVASC